MNIKKDMYESTEVEDEENEVDEDEIEMGLLHPKTSKKYFVPSGSTTLFAKTAIKNTEAYEALMIQERSMFLFWYVILVVVSPLVFRYGLGSNLIDLTATKKLLAVTNASLSITTAWEDCIQCDNYVGMTLKNVTIKINNVTNPDPQGNIPSVALFASQDFKNWYNLYSPVSIPEPYIDNWEHTQINIFNGSGMGCLGRVFHNYIVACLNVRDYALNLDKGDAIESPPFNDRCFMVDGICGVPCLDAKGSNQHPYLCDKGKIPLDLLVSNSSKTFQTGYVEAIWASNINWVEWIVIFTIFFDCFGNILRYMPVLSGRPTELESAKSCLCEGVVVLGCASPFVSEDEAIFLRSLIGRTVTIFHTIGGRHNLQGLYADIILNERRGKGEETRKMMYMAWLKFITLVGRLGIPTESDDSDDNNEEQNDGEDEEYDHFSERDERKSQHSMRRSNSQGTQESDNGNISLKKIYRQATGDTLKSDDNTASKSGDGQFHHRRKSVSGFYDGHVTRQSVIDIHAVDYQEHTRASMTMVGSSERRGSIRVNHDDVVNFQRKTRSSELGGVPTFKSRDMLQRMTIVRNNEGDDDKSERTTPLKTELQPFSEHEDLVFDLADLLPLICFLDGWLESIKLKEWTFNYTNKKYALSNYLLLNVICYYLISNFIFCSEAMESIFNNAPIEVYFEGADLLTVHDCLKDLFDAFTGSRPDPPDLGIPIYPDKVSEINWTICRRGLPNWTIAWTLMSRARLRPMSLKAQGDPQPPHVLFESTRVKDGAIVYVKPDIELPDADAPTNWLIARSNTYKVTKTSRSVDGTTIHLTAWPVVIKPGETIKRDVTPLSLPLDAINLVEKNRGKAGALNVCLDYLRAKSKQYVANEGLSGPVQTFMGIIDARHMLAEPEIFWNDGLPFFSRSVTGKSAKNYGEKTGGQQCIIVQYPQYFTNVTRDDFLDNKNSSYYTIWQTLRDCGKCTTSSGTNAIW
jgi:hypothetical protein